MPWRGIFQVSLFISCWHLLPSLNLTLPQSALSASAGCQLEVVAHVTGGGWWGGLLPPWSGTSPPILESAEAELWPSHRGPPPGYLPSNITLLILPISQTWAQRQRKEKEDCLQPDVTLMHHLVEDFLPLLPLPSSQHFIALSYDILMIDKNVFVFTNFQIYKLS